MECGDSSPLFICGAATFRDCAGFAAQMICAAVWATYIFDGTLPREPTCQKKTKHPITIIHRAFVMMTKYANVRSIFGSSLGCAASGTRLGCGRCPRTN